MTYYKRAIFKKIIEKLDIMPAVFLNGPRQAGKSTFMKEELQKAFPGKYDYVSFDEGTIFASASKDPEGFLRNFTKPVIIDEVQKVPQIFSGLKLLIDEYRQQDKASANGRFILTGSVSIMTLPKLSESLVGRIGIISLYPLSAIEVIGNSIPVINGWFDQKIPFEKDNELFILDNVIYKTSFPEIVDMDKPKREEYLSDYIEMLLPRYVRDLAEIEKIAFLPDMLKILAARAGSQLNDASFARDAQLNVMTYKRYRILLEQLFLITLVKPWYRNINYRLVRTPKVYFTDTALLCHQLGVVPNELKHNNTILYGHILENFVLSELQKQTNLLGHNYEIYYFRTYQGEEVDFIIERKNGSLIGIEVKSNYSITDKDFKSLTKLKESVGKDFVRGIVLYHGNTTIPFGENMVAMPISKLWNFNMVS